MARLGNKPNGESFFGDKSKKFVIDASRELVEQGNQFTILYFEVDYENSKRNFYGELLVRKWKNPKGIKVTGIIKLEDDTTLQQGSVPNKILKLEFGCYNQHLKDLNISPKIGDYFSVKDRIYYIYDKTTDDANYLTIGTEGKAYATVFKCVQSDSEQLLPPGLLEGTEGTKNEIEGNEK